MTQPEKERELFKELKIKWDDDSTKRFERLAASIEKRTTKLEIFEAKYSQLEEEIEQERASKQNKEIDTAGINEVIASLSLYGFPIHDFESLTCGQYDAYTKVAAKNANERKNNRK